MDTLITVTEGTTKTYTSSREKTSNLWVTIVTNGNTVVVQTTFAQRFTSQYDTVASPSSGSVGLGTISGTIGRVRTDMQSTVSGNAAVFGTSFFVSMLAFVAMFL